MTAGREVKGIIKKLEMGNFQYMTSRRIVRTRYRFGAIRPRPTLAVFSNHDGILGYLGHKPWT